MDFLNQISDDFRSDLDRFEHLLQIVKSLRDFGATSVPQEVHDGTVPWGEAAELLGHAQQRHTDMPIFSGSLLLYLSGRFEYFFRAAVEAAAEEIAGACSTFSELPDSFQKALIQRTADATQNSRRYGYDQIEVAALINNLANNLNATTDVGTINAATLTLTDSNLRPDAAQELLTRIALKSYWVEAGKQSKLKFELQTSNDTETKDAARRRLNEIMDERNSVAHPTAGTNFPDPDKVLAYSRFLRILGDCTVDILRVHVSGLQT